MQIKNELIAVVFHADPIKLAVANYLGLPLDNFQRLTIKHRIDNHPKIKRLRQQLLALNLIPPLPETK